MVRITTVGGVGAKLIIKDKNNAFRFLRKLPKEAPRIGNLETWNLTQQGARFLIESAIQAGITPWRNILLKFGTGITPRKIRKGTYGIFMPIYGIHLDRMRTHAVSLKRGRNITRWAQDKLATVGRGIVVSAHPYIDRGFRKMVNRADITTQRIANKIVGG